MGNPAPQSRTKTSKPDMKPKHRHSGSVSNISVGSQDFSSPNKDVSSPTSSVSSSSASLKEMRRKRRTRSSLGGTEDFIKELDFLTPSPNKKTPESRPPKECPRPSARSQLAESVSAAPEACAPVPEAGVPAPVKGSSDGRPSEQSNDPVAERACTVKENGVSSGEKVDCIPEKSVQPGGAGQYDDRLNGAEPVRQVNGELSGNELHQAVKYDSLGGNPLASKEAAASTLQGTLTGESGQIQEAGTLPVALEDSESISEAGPVPVSPVSDTNGVSSSQNIPDRAQGFTESEAQPPIIRSPVTSLAEEDSRVAPRKQELSKAEQGAKERQEEEKVSVQKRIEELERIAGGRPVHFRSQSLSLPKSFDISHARHHEAEGAHGFKMPLYKAPLDVKSVSEMDSSELLEAPQDEDLTQDAPESEMNAVTGSTLLADPAVLSVVHESGVKETEPQKVFKEEEQAEPQMVISEIEQRSNKVVSPADDGPASPEGLKTEQVARVNMLGDGNSEKGLNTEGPAASSRDGESSTVINTVESVESEMPAKTRTQAGAIEQDIVEIGEEDRSASSLKVEGGLESGLGEEYLIVSANSVPEGQTMATKELPSETPASNQMIGGKVETSQDPVLAEATDSGTLPEALPIGTVREAFPTGLLPEGPKMGTVPSVNAPTVEPSCPDDETSVLLTKQPAVDPLFVDSQQDRLWEMHSQELTLREGESSGQEVRESSAQDDDPNQYTNGTPTHADSAASGSLANGNAQSDKSSKIDRPRTPLRSLLAEEEAAEKGPGSESGSRSTTPQNQIASPRGNLFRRIVSGGRNSPPKQTTPSKFSPKNQTAAKPFLSSCICCSPVK